MGRTGRSCTGRTCKHADVDFITDVTSDVRATRSILTYLTRLLFVSIIISCVVVFVVSILVLAHCRHTVEPIEDLTGSSDGQCTSLGIPAYFACVILVIAVFGFGCVGRKVTGGMLVVVSALAMVVAVVVVVKQECGSEESSRDLTFTIYSIMEDCAQAALSQSNTEYAAWLRSRARPQDKQQQDIDCDHSLRNLRFLCSRHGFVSKFHQHNRSDVDSCVQHVRETLYSLCLKDGEITVPILLTLPIFYIGIGVGLVYIKHVDSEKSGDGGRGGAIKCHSVSTNTDAESPTMTRGGPLGAKLCHKCLSWLCFSNSLCFQCLVKGNGSSPCCVSRSRTPIPSRLSFQLQELSRDDLEAAQGILRKDSPPQHQDDMRAVEEQAKHLLVQDRIL